MNTKLSEIGKEGKGEEKEEVREPRILPPLIGTQTCSLYLKLKQNMSRIFRTFFPLLE